MEYYEEGRAIIAELIERGGGTETKFIETTGQIIRDTLDYVIDGEASLDDLEGCEKTVFGTKFEKRFVRAMGLPRKISKRVNPHNLTMDTRVAGYDLDIKCTLGSTWMIPREAIGNWCFLVQVDYKASDFSLGLFKALPENLTEGENRDAKKSVSARGKQTVQWITTNHSLPEGRSQDPNSLFTTICGRLEAALFASVPVPASEASAPAQPGVYAIYEREQLVYVGKATSLRQRLRKHCRTIADSTQLTPQQISFRYLPLGKNLMTGFEDYLIDTYRPSWNGTGFGSNAHGKGRANQKQSQWNKLYGRAVTR